jgi:hypothetical protein
MARHREKDVIQRWSVQCKAVRLCIGGVETTHRFDQRL